MIATDWLCPAFRFAVFELNEKVEMDADKTLTDTVWQLLTVSQIFSVAVPGLFEAVTTIEFPNIAPRAMPGLVSKRK